MIALLYSKLSDPQFMAMILVGIAAAATVFTVGILTYLSSPSYIELLWTTQTGKIALVVSGMWMATGVFVMKKMIAFDF